MCVCVRIRWVREVEHAVRSIMDMHMGMLMGMHMHMDLHIDSW